MKSIIASAVLLLLVGCGVRTEMVRVNVPDIRVNPESGPVILVGVVQDDRTDILPATPAPDRPRNVGGVARGGNGILVNLETGTASEKAREILVQALRNMGYRTTEQCDTDCMRLDATLTAFSVKMPVNIWRAATWSQQMLADIAIDVTARDGIQTRTFTAKGHGSNVYQVVSRENWEVALERAVRDVTSSFKQSMAEHEGPKPANERSQAPD